MNRNVGENDPIEHIARLDLFKLPKIPATRQLVMIAQTDPLMAVESRHYGVYLASLISPRHRHIAQMIHMILGTHDLVPALDHGFVHLFNGGEVPHRTPICPFESQNVRMIEVRIADEEDVRHIVLSCKSRAMLYF